MSALLEIAGLGVSLRGREILRDVSLSVAAGEFVALVGANGAGKTTLLRALLGLARYSGSAKLAGTESSSLGPRERAGRVAWLPQSQNQDEPWTAQELVESARYRFDETRAACRAGASNALDRAGASDFAARRVTELSGGERQRVMLACGLAQEAPLLLLDEPANHLDPAQQASMYQRLGALCREGLAVVCVTHDVNLLRYADNARVVGIHDATLAFDCALDDAALAERLGELWSCRVRESAGVFVAEPSA